MYIVLTSYKLNEFSNKTKFLKTLISHKQSTYKRCFIKDEKSLN